MVIRENSVLGQLKDKNKTRTERLYSSGLVKEGTVADSIIKDGFVRKDSFLGRLVKKGDIKDGSKEKA